MIKRTLLFSILLLSLCLCSDEVVNLEELKEDLKLYPLKVGNIWVYQVNHRIDGLGSGYEGEFLYYEKYEIVDIKEYSGNIFFKFVEESFYPDSTVQGLDALNAPHRMKEYPAKYQWQGVSFPDLKLLFGNPEYNNTYSYINFSMDKGEKYSDDQTFGYGIRVEVTDVGSEEIFGEIRNYKTFSTKAAYHHTSKKYVSGIGLFSGDFGEETYYNSGTFKLKGCLVDNILLGDTSIAF